MGIDNNNRKKTISSNSARVSKEKKPGVSILNFSRQSKNVIFTEPATIEAINRLGFEMSEFNFISPDSFDSGVSNPNLKETLYQRYLNKRQKMIEQTIKMRAIILDEKRYPVQISPVVRHEQMFLRKQQDQLEQLDGKSNYAFRKLALNRLHDLINYQNDLDLNQKLTNKFRDIDEVNKLTSDFISNIRSDEPPRGEILPNIANNYYNIPISSSQKKVAPSNLKESRMSQFERLRAAHYQREEKTNIIAERKALIDQQNQEYCIKKIQEKEERFKISSEAYKNAFNERLKDKKKLLKRRAKSVKIRKEERLQKKMDDTYESYKLSQMKSEQRLNEINQEKLDKAAIKRYKDREKTEKIMHSFNANNYKNSMERKKIKEDASGVERIKNEEKNVKNEMTGASLRISQKRARLNKAFDQIQSINDQEGLNKIQKIMELNDNQMHELVSSAYYINQMAPHNRKT